MNATAAPSPPVRTVAIVGAGVIGVSWAALMLAHGLDVVVHDIDPTAETRLRAGIAGLAPTLAALGLPTDGLLHRLRFEPDLSRAVATADAVQECGPERLAVKRPLWAVVERAAPADALLLSSSSGLTARRQATAMQRPGRLLVGHPINPPHLIPLVEVVPHPKAAPADTARAMAFYRALGKHPVQLHREVPGFVANRLQAALLREAVLMVKQDVVTVDELDEIVTHSIGLRWATGGPFRSFHIGGGPTGFRGFLKHFAQGVQLLWLHSRVSPVRFGAALNERLLAQIDATFGATPIPALEAERDARQIAVLRALASVDAVPATPPAPASAPPGGSS